MARAPTSRAKAKAAPATKPVPPADTPPADTPPADTPPAERRAFAVARELLHDGQPFAPGGTGKPALTEAQHDQLFSAGAVGATWPDGEPVQS